MTDAFEASTAATTRSFRPPAPVPPERPLGPLALLRTLRKNAIECWNEAHFKQPFVFGGLPFARTLVVSEPAAISQVLVEHQSDYCKSPLERRILSARLRDGLVAVEGEQWTRLRRVLAPLFARNTASRFGDAIESATAALVERWRALEGERVVEIKTEMLRVAIDVLLHAIFGDGLDDPDAVRDATTRYYSSCGRIDPFDIAGLPESIPRLTRLHVRGILRAFDEQLDRAIVQRRRRLTGQMKPAADILGAMLAARDPATGRSMSEAEIKDNILTFIFGGQETTSSALTWAVYLLTQSAPWRERVLCEAEETEGLSAHHALPRLVHTRAVVEEALRLYPPIIGITRMALRPTKIADLTIDRGTLVIIPPYVVHRHRRLWRDPDMFRPERFLPANAGSIRAYTYLPFGVGPRSCIGAALATQEATLTMAKIVRSFELALVPGQTVWPAQKHFTLRPRDGLRVRIEPRECGRLAHPISCAR